MDQFSGYAQQGALYRRQALLEENRKRKALGYLDGNPIQPGYPGSGPRADAAPVLSSVTDADVVRNAPGALSPMDQGQVPNTSVTASPPPNPNAAKSYADMNVSDFLRAADGANTTSVGDNHIGAAPGDPLSLPILEADNSYLESLDGETLRELAAEGNVGASAELKKRESAPGYTQPYSMDMPEQQVQPVLSNPDVNDPRTPAMMADGSAANRAVASSGGVLENTAEPKAAEAVLNQSNSVGGGSGGGNRTTGSTTQSTSRSVSPSTGNARGSQMGYGKANNAEMLMRVGGAMYSGSLKGDGIGAATREYGQIQDDRRAADTAAYEQSEATRLKEAAMRAAAARARASGTGGKAAAANAKALTGVNDAMYSLQRGLDAIADSRAAGGNLTGIGGIFKGLFDNFTGDADANRRLTLSRLKVDDALLRTAETKGAISNIEMALFLEPAPKNTMDEQVWVDWLNERMRTLRGVQYRLQTGEELPPEERSTRFNTTSGTFTPSSDVQAALDKYK